MLGNVKLDSAIVAQKKYLNAFEDEQLILAVMNLVNCAQDW